MIADLKPYPAYKDSGVPWLGEVPEHWEVRRLRNAVEMLVSNVDKHTKEGELPVRLCNYLNVYKKDRITDRMSFMQATATRDESERFRLERGDVLITKDSESWNDIGVPALVEYTASDLVCGYHLALLRPRNGLMDGGYLLRSLQSTTVAYQFHVSANGVTRYGLSHDAIKSVFLALPPLPEQSTIVHFLDYMDRRIRRYIRSKKKLIELLNEQKQAIIHRAVTRGLDPNVRLKPSGVEWLGDVPEHWEVRPLKQLLARMDYGTSANLGREGRIRVLTMGHIQDGEVIPPEHGSLSEVPPALLVKKDDLMFNRTNSPELVGKVGIFRDTNKDVSFASYLVRLRTKAEHDPQWLNYLLNSTRFWAYARSQALVSLHQANLNSTRYGQMLLPVPPEAEQRRIAEFIASAVLHIRNSVLSAEREIALLREYRTRLIADVVTGKLDVREAAARLPEEAEEPEPLDDADALAEGNEESEGADLDAVPEEAEA